MIIWRAGQHKFRQLRTCSEQKRHSTLQFFAQLDKRTAASVEAENILSLKKLLKNLQSTYKQSYFFCLPDYLRSLKSRWEFGGGFWSPATSFQINTQICVKVENKNKKTKNEADKRAPKLQTTYNHVP